MTPSEILSLIQIVIMVLTAGAAVYGIRASTERLADRVTELKDMVGELKEWILAVEKKLQNHAERIVRIEVLKATRQFNNGEDPDDA